MATEGWNAYLHATDIDIRADSISVLVPLNHFEFIVATCTGYINGPTGIMKFNTNTKEWTVWIPYPDDIESAVVSMAITKDKSFIYVHNDRSKVIKINTETKKFEVNNTSKNGEAGSSLCIDNIFHIIGGWNHASHCKIFQPQNTTNLDFINSIPANQSNSNQMRKSLVTCKMH